MEQCMIDREWVTKETLVIPNFPWRAGWRVVRFLQSHRHPRDAIVLCFRKEDDTRDEEFVVWTANTIEGGCHNGSYFREFGNAWTEFQRRIGSLN